MSCKVKQNNAGEENTFFLFILGITNNGFEHSVDWRDGRNLEETVFQNDVDQVS